MQLMESSLTESGLLMSDDGLELPSPSSDRGSDRMSDRVSPSMSQSATCESLSAR